MHRRARYQRIPDHYHQVGIQIKPSLTYQLQLQWKWNWEIILERNHINHLIHKAIIIALHSLLLLPHLLRIISLAFYISLSLIETRVLKMVWDLIQQVGKIKCQSQLITGIYYHYHSIQKIRNLLKKCLQNLQIKLISLKNKSWWT